MAFVGYLTVYITTTCLTYNAPLSREGGGLIDLIQVLFSLRIADLGECVRKGGKGT